jgi:hypothetical protein
MWLKVGNGDIDHSFWTRPEDMTMPRPPYFLDTTKRGSDVAGGTAAALAAGSIAFKNEGQFWKWYMDIKSSNMFMW